MSERKKMVIVISRGLDDERSSVAWSIANTAVGSDMEVTIFLVSSGVDWVRRGAAGVAHLNPLDPTMNDMVSNVLASDGRVLVWPPCAKVRGYDEDGLVEGVIIAGAPALLETIRNGADTLCF